MTQLPDVIRITAVPTIRSSVDELALVVKKRIAELRIEEIEPTEENKKLLKDTRANLNKEIKDYEEQRKKIKELLLKDYNVFEEEYKKKIKTLYDETDKTLKEAIDKIQREQDQELKDYALEYLNERLAVNNPGVIEFDQIRINYANKKQIRLSIDNYIDDILKSLNIIKTYGENEGRLYAIWLRTNFNLVEAITQLNNDIAVEKQLAREIKEREAREALAREMYKVEEITTPEEVEEAEEDFVIEVEELSHYSLTVKATPSQLEKLLEFLLINDYDYDLE
ncbi:MAG: DUF1351 domain-containing protein [Bacteroidia bacterium]|nr:DUF1351 domain-containing protein [Bacteroidia bacterium]